MPKITSLVVFYCLCLFLLTYSSLLAESFISYTRTLEEKNKVLHISNIHADPLPSFTGLLLIDDLEKINPMGYENICGILPYQIDLPGKKSQLKQMLDPFFEKPLTKANVEAIQQTVYSFYQKNNHPLTLVIIPAQNISQGTLQLIIKEGKLGKICVTNNRWFRSQNIEKAIRIKPGEVLTSNRLNQDLYWLNRNPFRQVDAIYFPGEQEGTTDLELHVRDRFPFRVYTGIDNTGNDVTGNNRFIAGFNWGNIFHTDQTLSYQFSSSSDFKRLNAHMLFYQIPLPYRHVLTLYGGYSFVNADFGIPNVQNDMFHTDGFTLEASARYDIILISYNHFLQEITAGFDFKRTNNNLAVGGIPIISSDGNVNLAQIMLSYHLGYTYSAIKLSFQIEGFLSPGQWLADQSNKKYQSLRPFSKNQYVYARSATTLDWKYYKNWSMRQIIRWQIASINLLPSEEYGVGGYNTVRGYKERIVNGDNIFIWNLEMHTPPSPFLSLFHQREKFHDTISFLLFFDYGLASVKEVVPQQKKTTYLASIGPGVRYQIDTHIHLRADWGFQLHDLHLGGPHQRLHFSLIVSY